MSDRWASTRIALALVWVLSASRATATEPEPLAGLLALGPEERQRALGERLARPQSVSWQAGEHDLGSILERLEEGGNRVLVALGVDRHRRAHLEAYTGGFWSGLLRTCAAFDLDFDLPRAAADEGEEIRLVSGPVLVRNRNPAGPRPQRWAQGPVLVQLHALVAHSAVTVTSGHHHWVDIELVVATEPRLPADSFTALELTWNHARSASGEHALGPPGQAVLAARARPPPLVRSATVPSGSGASTRLTVTGTGPGVGPVHLSGGLACRLSVPWQVTVSMAVDGRERLRLAGYDLDLLLIGQVQADMNALAPGTPRHLLQGDSIVLAYARHLFRDLPRLSATTADGTRLMPLDASQGSTSGARHYQAVRLEPLDGRGELDITVAAQVVLGQVHLPLDLDLDLGR